MTFSAQLQKNSASSPGALIAFLARNTVTCKFCARKAIRAPGYEAEKNCSACFSGGRT